jgi:hypothetical protein
LQCGGLVRRPIFDQWEILNLLLRPPSSSWLCAPRASEVCRWKLHKNLPKDSPAHQDQLPQSKVYENSKRNAEAPRNLTS